MATVALGQKAVGSVVKLKFNGAMREFLVVHQGRPSTLYDASCDGTWLLMEDCPEAKRWHSSDVNDYANSEVNSYLNSTVLSKFDADIQAQIKQVKIPYRPGSGTSGTVNSGANGLSVKIFLLSDREVGYTKSNVNSYICDDGAKLDYFIEGGNTTGSDASKRRIANYNGSAVYWWLRSPYLYYSTFAWYVNSNGNAGYSSCSYTGYYLRPALILPSNLLTSDDGSVQTNTAPSYVPTLGTKAEGSIVKLKENGAPIEFYIAKQEYESELNGPGRVLVVRKDCYDQRQWHSADVNAYAASDIDSWLNGDYKNLLDTDIQAVMGTTKFYYTPGNGNTTKTILERVVFLLSGGEMDLSSSFNNGTALSSTVIGLLKIAYLNNSAVTQWTRDPQDSNTTSAVFLDSGGGSRDHGCYVCTRACGSRPVFTLPASLYVDDDGTITTNTVPSAASGITVPGQINGGSTITISWGAATDAEGNLEGYIVDRSTDGGSTWAQIYQGSATSTTNTVPFGTESVMYRVKAYDSEGLCSGYRTSRQITVINNNAPGIPASITIPNEVLGGKPLTITWGAATDVDGDLAGYALERQVDGGDSWTEVYQGSNLSYTDTVTRGWASVCYRVRAYDSHNAYGGYATSQSRPVNNNIVPVVTCSQGSGADLGTKNGGFSVAYSVEDPDGDSVTVTEAIDGVTKRTFTPEPGTNNAFAITGEVFMCLLNGQHTMTITASDGKGSTVHTLTFTKEIHAASITLAEPLDADAKIEICVMSVIGQIPADAEYSVKVTNNANDTEPVWEDCTAEVKAGANHVFTNTTATNGFAFNFKIEVERGASGEGGYISSAQGGFQ